MTQFKRSEVSLLIKARSKLLNLNNFKAQFNGDVSRPRCDLGIDDENHVFTSCAKLKNFHAKYEIHGFEDTLKIKLKKEAWFLSEAALETCNQFHNILRFFDVSPIFSFTTSEMMCNYYL